MDTKPKSGFFSNLGSDLPASIVVFLVALPLCLGIALASDAPLFSGLIAGIIGGTIVALISGSPLGVSGPAAGLAAIVAGGIKDLGGLEFFDVFILAVVIAGVIQIILGVIKAGVIGYYFPGSVIKGMLAGIGIFIFLKQIPDAFGKAKHMGGDSPAGNPVSDTIWTAIAKIPEYFTPGALVITLVSLGLILLWDRPFMKKLAFTKILPGSLVAVIIGAVLASVFQDTGLSLGEQRTVNLGDRVSSFDDFVGLFTFPDFSQIGNSKVWVLGATIAVVASLETLLCVEATDKLDPQKRVTPTNRELIAQGVGNSLSGLIGGLPITQVIVRSSANIQTGGKTKASAFFHGILLLVCVLTIPNILNLIPYASLAAILFVVGFKLARPAVWKEMWNKGLKEFVPFVVTVLVIVFVNLLWGIGIGLVVAILIILWNNFRTPYHFNPEAHVHGEPIVIELSEDVSFLNKASIQRTLNMIPNDETVIIDSTKSQNIHPDIREIFEDFAITAEQRNIVVTWKGSKEPEDLNPLKQLNKILPKD